MQKKEVTINKLVVPGKVLVGNFLRPLFVHIQYNTTDQRKRNCANEFSFTGVVGPLKSGNAYGSCGQVLDEILEIGEHNAKEGWGALEASMLYRYWKLYHMNRHQHRCIHQEDWDTEKKITVYNYKRGPKWHEAHKMVLEGKCKSYQQYLTLTECIKRVDECVFDDSYKGGPTLGSRLFEELVGNDFIKIENITEEMAGRVLFRYHPEGLIGKPCNKCGFRYGTGYNTRPVPADVMAWIRALPETKIPYAWEK